MKKLLITGFDPFGGESINPAWEAVKLLPDVIGECELIKMEIPTVFGAASREVLDAAQQELERRAAEKKRGGGRPYQQSVSSASGFGTIPRKGESEDRHR